MDVEIVPCLQDNYAYVIACGNTGSAIVVDPSEAEPVVAALESMGVTLAAVFATHHHMDHVGGVAELKRRYPQLRVIAHPRDAEHIEGVTERVEHLGKVTVEGTTFRAQHVPGHTLGAVAWESEGALFTGDTLFLAGCGRLFEGTADQMHHSISNILGSLDDDTRIYCGHEYTVSNLRFAAHLDPENSAVKQALEAAERRRSRGEPTVPGLLRDERAVNPFLRVGDAVAFARVRAMKDTFRA
jgi:hydroxyacylglutathione hydrolase